ncbi:MAG: oligosaccharide flippase family protein [Bacteroidales bacterium]|nr:oligosaccharide flippase family protein [Bacteroidales bacterium]MBN2820714.1 oligosaccharide flippase family protein [Bacteroidales bacterium]
MKKISDFLTKYKGLIDNFKNAFLYFGGSFLQLCIAIFTSPIFARNLSAEEFGILGYFTSARQFVFPLTTMTLTWYYLFKYFKQDSNQNKKLLSNIIVFLTYVNILVLFISAGALYTYFKIVKVEIPFYPFAFIMLITLFLEVYQIFLLMELKLKKAAFTYFLYTGLLAVLSIAFGLLFVVVFKWGAAGRMFGSLVGLIVTSLIFIKQFKFNLKIKLDFKLIKEAMWWASPMLLSAYFYLPMANIDRLLLGALKDTSELGYYSIGANVAGYIGTAAAALFSAFQPDFYKFVAQNNKGKFFLFSGAYVIVLVFMTIMFFIFSEFIVNYLTSGRYTRAYIYANYYVVAILIMNITSISNAILIALGKSRFQLYINIIAGSIGFVLYKYFIHQYGFMGGTYGRISIACLYLVTQVSFILYLKFKPFNLFKK